MTFETSETVLRCFFALPLDDAARAELAGAVRALEPAPWSARVRWVPPENLHLTLSFLGAVAPARARVVVAAIAPQPDLEALAEGVAQRLAPLGFAPETRAFRPHVTLGRARRAPLRGLRLDAPVAPCAVPVRDVVLYRSDTGPGGSRYRALARLPLGGARSGPARDG
jgi:2'-5' RNA ligase